MADLRNAFHAHVHDSLSVVEWVAFGECDAFLELLPSDLIDGKQFVATVAHKDVTH